MHIQDVGDWIGLKSATSGIFDIYAESHLFAIPSRWESFPNALAEALIHGLPSAGFADVAGVADLIAASGGGWLAPGLVNEKSSAEKLDRAMTNAPELERRSRLAIAGMAAFALEKQFDHWAVLLDDVVAERKQ